MSRKWRSFVTYICFLALAVTAVVRRHSVTDTRLRYIAIAVERTWLAGGGMLGT